MLASSTLTFRRATLYVPGNDEAKIVKIPKYNADSVILDCEDGVALNRKVLFVSSVVSTSSKIIRKSQQ